MTDADFEVSPTPEPLDVCPRTSCATTMGPSIASRGRDGWAVRCAAMDTRHPGRPSRAIRDRPAARGGRPFEAYEPARSITANVLAGHRTDPSLSTSCLAAELARLVDSPIVLNRRLREAVQSRLARGHLTMSEIAIRCGRCKCDRRGNVSGETSWLARRIGQASEAGRIDRRHGCTVMCSRSSRATASLSAPTRSNCE